MLLSPASNPNRVRQRHHAHVDGILRRRRPTDDLHGPPNDSLFDDRLQIDDNSTAGQTRLLLWDVDSGSLRRVGVYNDGTRDLLYLV